MSTQPKTWLTPEQYLEIERRAEYKELRIDNSGLGEMLPEEGVNSAVLFRAQVPLVKKRLGDVEHGIVRPPCREIQVVVPNQRGSRADCAGCLVQKLSRSFLHAATASSRTLARKALSCNSQSRSGTKTELTLTP